MGCMLDNSITSVKFSDFYSRGEEVLFLQDVCGDTDRFECHDVQKTKTTDSVKVQVRQNANWIQVKGVCVHYTITAFLRVLLKLSK